jgi:hypothetical protein
MSRRHNGTYNALKEYQKIQHDREMNKKYGYKIEIKMPNMDCNPKLGANKNNQVKNNIFGGRCQ